MNFLSENNLWNFLRLSIASIMLWAFFDKLLGLGFATMPDKSWIVGVSPTAGFLAFAPDGVFASFFHSLSGNGIVDILFMSGLLLVGLCLALGIGIRVACMSGSLMMFFIYLSLFPPENNPLIDEHIVYIIAFLLLAHRSTKQNFFLHNKWKKVAIVKQHPILA
ncbi:MAG: hypothetical protein HZC02_05405 [Candidatus Levybacteria bacterium]|nr:hypothetical protein [Candidatus Levybacteria bacterium]